MKLRVVAVGRVKSGPERDLVERYSERLRGTGRSIGVGGVDLIEIPESRAANAAARKREEADAFENRLKDCSTLIAFDERGQHLTSRAFAALIERGAQAGAGDMAFLIGGPDGLDPAIRERANTVVAFGSLTMPHQLVRVLVLEQLYRAATILTGHPYHRD